MTREVYLIIPNSDIGGAQNFFKRLFNNLEVENKQLVVENPPFTCGKPVVFFNYENRAQLIHRFFSLNPK